MGWIDDSIDRLLVKSEGEINSRLECISTEFEIAQTKAVGHCYCVKLDGNGNPRWKDLVDFLSDHIVNYAIPRKEILEAKSYFDTHNSTSKIIQLKRKAAGLFTDIKTTGEGGEMLLYVLIQEYLKIPQLISKMSLKTSGNVHYHGVDGVHVKYEEASQSLVLYWGESKMYGNINTGLKSCFESLKGFMLDPHSYKSTQERDLALITTNIGQNVNDEELENFLVRYFDKDDDISNNLKYKGLCFVGFDSNHYPDKPLTLTLDELKEKMVEDLVSWTLTASAKIIEHSNLELFEIHLFLIPFPSVQEFRDYFIETISA